MATKRQTRRWLKLANGHLTAKPSNKPGIGVGMSLRFDLQAFTFRRFGLFERKIRIGVNEAELLLRLRNGEMPDEDWAYDDPIQSHREISYELKNNISNVNEDGRVYELVANFNVGVDRTHTKRSTCARAGSAAKLQKQEKRTRSDAFDSTVKFSAIHKFVTALGDMKKPRWLIKSPPELPVLRGSVIKTEHFARFCSNGSGARIDMFVEIPRHAIVIQDESGAFNSVNKRILAHIRVAKDISREPLSLDSLRVEDEDDSR